MMDRKRASRLSGMATALALLSCYGTTLLIGLLALLGITVHIDNRAWAAAISFFAFLAVLAVAVSSRRHRSLWPAGIAVAGLVLILWSLYGRYVLVVEALGFALLILATLWDRRMGGTAAASTASWIEPEELAGRLKSRPAPTVIDVRGPDEFVGPLGHIAAARNLPVADLAERLREVEQFRREPVILVCRTDKRSGAASSVLRDAGFADVRVLRGGMERWNQEQRPVTTAEMKPTP